MRNNTETPAPAETRHVAELIEQLARTEQALEDSLKGQADAVVTRGGHTLLLRSAQERLTHDEEVQRCAAALQRGILDGLPANIALLDQKGAIVTVNATWRQFGLENGHARSDAGVGENYLAVCEAVQGEDREQALAAALGIRQVLAGARPLFSQEYACHSPQVRRWFRMTVTPLPEVSGGAVVMHVDVTERHLAEEAARAGEARFRAILDSGADMISLSDKDGRILFASPSVSRVLGYDPANEVVGRAMLDFVHPEDRECFCVLYRRALSSPRANVRGLTRVRHRSGEWRVASGGFTNLLDDPAIGAVVGNFRDVTEEEEGRRTLDRMFELSLDMLSVVGFDGRFKRVNSAFERVLGYSEAELLTQPYASLVHPDDLDRTLEAAAKLARGEDLPWFENRYRCRDGSYRWFQWACRSYPSEQIIYSVTRDVTERRHAEREAARLAAIVESSDDAIIGTDLEGCITSWNTGATALFGFTAEEMVGERILRLSPPERHPELAWILAQIARGEPVRHFETERRGKSGAPVSVSITVSPIRDRAGRIVGASKIVRDITQRKRAQLALEAAQRRLVVASRQAGMAEVASNVLHNVGNVLNGVNISAEVVAGLVRSSSAANLGRVSDLLNAHTAGLGEYLTAHPQGKQLPTYLTLLATQLADERSNALRELDCLRHSIDHIKEIIASQQDHARRGGVVVLVSAVEIMEEALRITATALELHEIRLVRTFAEAPSLRTDKHQVLQILVNLLRNACDALREAPLGGRVLTVAIGRAEGDRLCFVVEDNGPGIAPENLPRLFEHGFTTRKTGHGFGLHSAALLAQDLGGTLAAASAGPGQGAVFRLELPLDRAKRTEGA